MTVYVVTSGEYSDYSIEAIFSTKELAQQYIDETAGAYRWGAVNSDIGEYELDNPESGVGKLKYWEVTYSYYRSSTNENHSVYLRGTPEGATSHAARCVLDKSNSQRCDLSVYVFAVDAGGAAKIASEIRAQLVADNKWFAKNPFDVGQPETGAAYRTTSPVVHAGDVSITMSSQSPEEKEEKSKIMTQYGWI